MSDRKVIAIDESKSNPEFLSELKVGDRVREKGWKPVYTVTAKRGKKVTLEPEDRDSNFYDEMTIFNGDRKSVSYDAKEGLYIIEGLVKEDIEGIDEDRWITMHGAHFLVSDKGKTRDKEMDKKINGNMTNKVRRTISAK